MKSAVQAGTDNMKQTVKSKPLNITLLHLRGISDEFN